MRSEGGGRRDRDTRTAEAGWAMAFGSQGQEREEQGTLSARLKAQTTKAHQNAGGLDTFKVVLVGRGIGREEGGRRVKNVRVSDGRQGLEHTSIMLELMM